MSVLDWVALGIVVVAFGFALYGVFFATSGLGEEDYWDDDW